MRQMSTHGPAFHNGHRAYNVPKRLAHFVSTGVKDHAVSQQRPVWCNNLPVGFGSGNSCEELALEPSAVLI